MMHEKTFDAINKLKEVEFELHRLKNALEMANRALDSMTTKREWVGLTDEELSDVYNEHYNEYVSDNVGIVDVFVIARAIETKLKEKNGG